MAPGAGIPTGSVQFQDNGSNLGSTLALNASGVASFTVSSLTAGTHFITASYPGDANFTANGANVTSLQQEVNQAATTTTDVTQAGAATGSSVFGQPVTLTATVQVTAPGLGAPTGTVTFVDGGVNLGIAVPDPVTSIATFSSAKLAVGSHTITAKYSGDPNFIASNDSGGTKYVQTINKASDTATVSAPVGSTFFGNTIVYTATVTATAPGGGAPTGSVSFVIKNGATQTAAGSGVLVASGSNSSKATFTTTGQVGGTTQTVTATYAGDTNFNAAAAAATNSSAIAAALTKTSAIVSTNNQAFGANWTVTGTASAKAPSGAGTPGSPTLGANGAGKISFTITVLTNATATNTFSAGATYTQPLGSFNVGSTGSASTSPILPGALKAFDNTGAVISLTSVPYTITANFVPTGTDFAASLPADSGSVVETVTNVNTVTQLSVTPVTPPPQAGQKLTLTATVTATGNSLLPPIGSVTFKDGTTTLGTAALPVPVSQVKGASKATATFSTSSLSIGNHALSATYTGDTSPAPDFTTGPGFTAFPSVVRSQWNGSGPTVFGVSVKPLTTFGKLTALPTSQVVGGTVTFSDVVTSSISGQPGGTPSGLVQFKDGTTIIGAASLDATGKATFSTNTLSVGNHLITAIYNAHLTFAGDTSNSLNEIINQTVTTTKFGGSASQVVTVSGATDITATVSPVNGTVTPTGTVVFVAESNARTAAGQSPDFGAPSTPTRNPTNLQPFTIGTATLVGGVAVLSLPGGFFSASTVPAAAQVPDIYEVEAFYNGDGNSFQSHTKPINQGPTPGPRGIEFVVQDSSPAVLLPALPLVSGASVSHTGNTATFSYFVRPSTQPTVGNPPPLSAETGGFGGTVDLIVDGTLIVHQKVLSLTGRVDLVDSSWGPIPTTHTVTINYNGDAGNPAVLATVGYAPYPIGATGWLQASTLSLGSVTAIAQPAHHSASQVAVVGTALHGTPNPAPIGADFTPARSTTSLQPSRVDGYFASSSTTSSSPRTLAGALAKHSSDDWLNGPF
jgi:hypothetical protein